MPRQWRTRVSLWRANWPVNERSTDQLTNERRLLVNLFDYLQTNLLRQFVTAKNGLEASRAKTQPKSSLARYKGQTNIHADAHIPFAGEITVCITGPISETSTKTHAMHLT